MIRQYAAIIVKVALLQDVEEIDMPGLLDKYREEGAAKVVSFETVTIEDTSVQRLLGELLDGVLPIPEAADERPLQGITNKRLLGVLEDIEWHQPLHNGDPRCPYCDNIRPSRTDDTEPGIGHANGCRLKRLIDDALRAITKERSAT